MHHDVFERTGERSNRRRVPRRKYCTHKPTLIRARGKVTSRDVRPDDPGSALCEKYREAVRSTFCYKKRRYISRIASEQLKVFSKKRVASRDVKNLYKLGSLNFYVYNQSFEDYRKFIRSDEYAVVKNKIN